MKVLLFIIFLFAADVDGAVKGCDGYSDGDTYPIYDGACTSEYYECSKGYHYRVTCNSTSLVYNEDTAECDYPVNVASCTLSGFEGCTDDNGYAINTGISFTYATDCEQGYYYTCQKGMEIQHRCNSGDLYDVEHQKCVDASLVPDCKSLSISNGVITVTTTPEATTTPIITPEPLGNTYVGFVIDQTASMYHEIDALHDWIQDCIGRNDSSCGNAPTGGWLTESFNDPYTSAVVGPTTNTDAILNAISQYYAGGGGDCPEKAMTGLENMLNAIPDENSGCKIYLFTDATPKDYNLRNQVTSLLQTKTCSLVSVLTGCCGTCPPPCDTVSADYCVDHVTDYADNSTRAGATYASQSTLFYEMSNATEGNIYVRVKPVSAEDMQDYLEDYLTLGFCPSLTLAGTESMRYSCAADCTVQGMCWDHSLSQCFCNGTCRTDPVTPSQC